MKIELTKEILLETLSQASRFTSSKIATSPTLQGIYITSKKTDKETIHVYASDLNSFFHTTLKANVEGEGEIIVEPKRIMEFVTLLNPGPINIETKDKLLVVSQGKKTGSFPRMVAEDFPTPPVVEEKEQMVKTSFLGKHLPLVLFSTSSDEARPVLTGVNFVTSENEMIMVSTDGFRLTLVKTKKEIDIPPLIIPGSFLEEVLSLVKGEKEVGFSYSPKERLIRFRTENTEFYSRLIDGEFPPYEKVLPVEKKTEVVVDTEEFMKNVKLISVFAREYSNIILLEARKTELVCRPKIEGTTENMATQEAEIKGEEQRVAFNFRFLLDFLNHATSKRVSMEVLRPDAPIVFKMEGNADFVHIIMPVRIQ